MNVFDQVEKMNILYVYKYFHGNLPMDTLETLKFAVSDHSEGTRGNTIGLLQRRNVNTTYWGLNSFTRLCCNQWNALQISFPHLNLTELKISELKTLSVKFYSDKYL